ncbi:four-carbon acid sugar kinase family protein [Acidovorax sp.]|uniref:four-carbon acid sugar kinase family protein n=1 Tax=Acidovorax sp. TaxID=1872122 RepID=UPI002625AFE9|nr:four-carbon acid sugar kinase family protein [Acidovorax sp.]
MSQARPLPQGPLVAFYGDDFTGSSAAMEVLAFAGLETILFLKPPTPERLSQLAGYRAIGIAGVARSRTPGWMDEHLPPIYELLRQIGAPVIHYKVCSTFDSAPHIGNIGRAAELGQRAFPGWIPLVVSDPGMGRFQAFGHLFAHASGVGYRLDRHPTMSAHPTTPMHESDLGRHLVNQTDLRVGLVDFATMKRGGADAQLAQELDRGAAIVSLDVLDAETLREAGRLIWERSNQGDARQFVVGSQGVEQALVAYWRGAGLVAPTSTPTAGRQVERIAAVSGSVSPITAAQIRHAAEHGFEPIALDVALAVDAPRFAAEIERATQAALTALDQGRSPLIYTAAGPDDPRVSAFRAAVQASGTPISVVNERLAVALGDILNALVRQRGLRRVVISGGDTSSHAASRLDIDALSAIAPLSPGVPLCRAHSSDPAIDGLEMALKGGQTGAPDFFAAVRDAR